MWCRFNINKSDIDFSTLTHRRKENEHTSAKAAKEFLIEKFLSSLDQAEEKFTTNNKQKQQNQQPISNSSEKSSSGNTSPSTSENMLYQSKAAAMAAAKFGAVLVSSIKKKKESMKSPLFWERGKKRDSGQEKYIFLWSS